MRTGANKEKKQQFGLSPLPGTHYYPAQPVLQLEKKKNILIEKKKNGKG